MSEEPEADKKHGEEGVQSFSKSSVSEEIKKGRAVRDQIGQYLSHHNYIL